MAPNQRTSRHASREKNTQDPSTLHRAHGGARRRENARSRGSPGGGTTRCDGHKHRHLSLRLCTRAALRTVWSRRPRVCSRRGTGASQPASSVFVDCKHCCTRDLKKTWSRGRLRRPKPPGSSTSPVAGGEAQFVHFGLGAKHSRGDHVVAADQGHPLDQRRPRLRPRGPPRQVAVGRFEPAGARAASDPGPSPRDDPRAPPPARHTPRAQTLRPPTL